MYTKDAIKYSLNLAEQGVLRSMANIEDAPLTFPTENGGCHPLWVLGHIAFAEGMTNELLTGRENPAGDWASLFGQDSMVTDDVSKYPSLEEVREKYLQLRKANLQLLDSLSESDLDKATSNPPKGLEEHFATYGKSLLTLALHQMSHRSHITDAIRSAGRAAPIAVAA